VPNNGGYERFSHSMPNHAKHRLPKSTALRGLTAAAVATAAVAVSVSGATAWAAQPSAASSSPVVVDSLSVSPSAPSAGAAVTAIAKLHATHTIAVSRLTIAVRSASGAHYDFSGAIPTTLSTSRTTFTPESRTFPAGTYTYFVAYEVGNTWHNLTPTQTFTSRGASPAVAPTPTPKASSKATPTASPTTAHTAAPTAPATPSASPSASATAGATATATSTPASSGPIGMPGTWHSVFDDEFNGTGLDSTKWTPNWLGCQACTTAPVNSTESEAYAPSQVSVSGGSLHLQSVEQSTTVNGQTYPYRSGMVQSNGKAEFTYGAFEARIYLPPSSTGIANWPAFWMDGQSWPTDGELDVMEGLGGSACFHFHSPSGAPGSCAPGNFSGWHTYGADWEPGSVTYYYDGKEVGQITTGITSAPQFLILDNAVGADGGQTVAPADMQVDYVRVWQH